MREETGWYMDSRHLGVLVQNGFQGAMGKGEDLLLFVEEHPSTSLLWHWGRNTAISRFHRSLLSDWQSQCRGWFPLTGGSECIG